MIIIKNKIKIMKYLVTNNKNMINIMKLFINIMISNKIKIQKLIKINQNYQNKIKILKKI